MVAWYRGENNADDSSGNGFKTVLKNGTKPSIRAKSDKHLDLTVKTDDISINGSSTLNVGSGNGLTIETWINTTTLSNEKAVAEWNNGSLGVHFWINTIGSGFESGLIFANVVDSNGNWHFISTDSAVVTANSFQHIALTYDKVNGTASLFHNGILVKQQILGIFTPQTTPSHNLYLKDRARDVRIRIFKEQLMNLKFSTTPYPHPKINQSTTPEVRAFALQTRRRRQAAVT